MPEAILSLKAGSSSTKFQPKRVRRLNKVGRFRSVEIEGISTALQELLLGWHTQCRG